MHVDITNKENILHYFNAPKSAGREARFRDENARDLEGNHLCFLPSLSNNNNYLATF